MATSAIGPGKPAQLNIKSRVAQVDCKNGSVTLENGEVFSGDVVIGADGVHVGALQGTCVGRELT